MSVIVYHGSAMVVEKPNCGIGRDNLDFGKGFYVTDLRKQAERWAKSVAFKRDSDAIINVYELDREAILASYRCLIFTAYDEQWLNFIVANRDGGSAYKDYDYVEGGVADDRVIDTINLYIGGLLDMEAALKRLSLFQPNNQICLLKQTLVEKYMKFIGYERAK